MIEWRKCSVRNSIHSHLCTTWSITALFPLVGLVLSVALVALAFFFPYFFTGRLFATDSYPSCLRYFWFFFLFSASYFFFKLRYVSDTQARDSLLGVSHYFVPEGNRVLSWFLQQHIFIFTSFYLRYRKNLNNNV